MCGLLSLLRSINYCESKICRVKCHANMTDEAKIRQRIENFIVDFSKWNFKAYHPLQKDDCVFLNRVLDEGGASEGDDCLDRHFVSREVATDAIATGGIGPDSAHDPKDEFIESISVCSNTAKVVTRAARALWGGAYEYNLRRVEGEWLISEVETFLSKRDQKPAIAPLPVDSDLSPIPVEKLPEGLVRLFEGEQCLVTPYREEATRVQLAGHLTNHSGFLACGDYCEWYDEISFFDLRIPPGRYPIECVETKIHLVAARVIFDASVPVSSYALATQIMAPNPGRKDWTREMSQLVAVRSCAGLGDAAYLASCTSEELEHLADESRHFYSLGHSSARIVEMDDQSTIVFFSAGNGGCVPIWALSEHGQPVMLYIDFVECAQRVSNGPDETHYYAFVGPSPSDDAHWLGLATRLNLYWPDHLNAACIREAHREEERHYHTLAHLNDCLEALDEARAQALVPNADAIELALWFHDLIYDPRANNNELESAHIAESCLMQAGADQSLMADVKRLILSTKDHRHDGWEVAQWMLDIDLSIFGQQEERFLEYERQIRKEYEWVLEKAYREARVHILAGFLERPRIYQTQYFYDRLEAQARTNLERLIRSLQE
jgi:predicted metal-dependent HD superfamily phosphohydrolase